MAIIRTTYKLEGFAEFEAQLKALADGYRHDLVARNTLGKAGKAAMQPVYEKLISIAPYNDKTNKSGIHLRDTAKIISRIPNKGDMKSNYVESTDNIISAVTVKKSAVSLAIEFGTANMSARPLLRSALESTTPEVLSILKSQLAEIIPAYWKTLKRRGIK